MAGVRALPARLDPPSAVRSSFCLSLYSGLHAAESERPHCTTPCNALLSLGDRYITIADIIGRNLSQEPRRFRANSFGSHPTHAPNRLTTPSKTLTQKS
jgi:hypothetical protein